MEGRGEQFIDLAVSTRTGLLCMLVVFILHVHECRKMLLRQLAVAEA